MQKCQNEIICDGATSCKDSIIYPKENEQEYGFLDCLGDQSCLKSNIKAIIIKCIGNDMIQGTICPNFKRSISESDDQRLIQYIEHKQRDKIYDKHYIESLNDYSENDKSDNHNVRELLEDQDEIEKDRYLMINQETRSFMKDSHNSGLRGIGLYLFLLLMIIIFSCVCILGICCINNSVYTEQYPVPMYESLLTKRYP